MRFSPEEKVIISFYDATSRMDLISQMEVAVTHIEDEELRDRTQFIINKLTFMTDEEFEAEDFTSNIGTDEQKKEDLKMNDLQAVEKNQKINVLICEPLTAPYMKEIGSELESLQATVGGGLIQAIYPFEDQVALVCNDEGKINGMTLNRAVYGDEGQMLDIIAGPFFICGLTEDSFESLSPELAEKYANLFYHPEIFVREGDEIKAIPVKPSVRDNLKSKTDEIKKETQGRAHNKSEHEI